MPYEVIFTDSLSHHGIKGMRWGVRRYRNEDGSLTDAGRRRYDIKEARKEVRKARNEAGRSLRKESRILPITPKRYNKLKETRKESDEALKTMFDKKADYAYLKGSDKRVKSMYSKSVKNTLNVKGGIKTRKLNKRIRKAVYNSMTEKKGKEYADKIVKKEYTKKAVKVAAEVGGIVYLAHKTKKLLGYISQYDASIPRLEGTMKVLN